MLAEFQQALADLTASPDLCNRARKNPAILFQDYDVTQREWRRLIAIVNHPGMQCACIVYRANRLAPLLLNVNGLCKALGPELRAVASDFWRDQPESNVHFFVEAERFCAYVQAELDRGRNLPASVPAVLTREWQAVAAALEESHTEGK